MRKVSLAATLTAAMLVPSLDILAQEIIPTPDPVGGGQQGHAPKTYVSSSETPSEEPANVICFPVSDIFLPGKTFSIITYDVNGNPWKRGEVGYESRMKIKFLERGINPREVLAKIDRNRYPQRNEEHYFSLRQMLDPNKVYFMFSEGDRSCIPLGPVTGYDCTLRLSDETLFTGWRASKE